MYVNGKMIPVENVPGVGGGLDKGELWRGVNSSMIYLIHCKNFHKCHSVPLPSKTIKKIFKETKIKHMNFYKVFQTILVNPLLYK
jgi:hypothetical protein